MSLIIVQLGFSPPLLSTKNSKSGWWTFDGPGEYCGTPLIRVPNKGIAELVHAGPSYSAERLRNFCVMDFCRVRLSLICLLFQQALQFSSNSWNTYLFYMPKRWVQTLSGRGHCKEYFTPPWGFLYSKATIVFMHAGKFYYTWQKRRWKNTWQKRRWKIV